MFHFQNSQKFSVYYKAIPIRQDFYWENKLFTLLNMYYFEEGLAFEFIGIVDEPLIKLYAERKSFDTNLEIEKAFEYIAPYNLFNPKKIYINNILFETFVSNSGFYIPELGYTTDNDAKEILESNGFLNLKSSFFYKRIYIKGRFLTEFDVSRLVLCADEKLFDGFNKSINIHIPQQNYFENSNFKVYFNDNSIKIFTKKSLTENTAMVIKILIDNKVYGYKIIKEQTEITIETTIVPFWVTLLYGDFLEMKDRQICLRLFTETC